MCALRGLLAVQVDYGIYRSERVNENCWHTFDLDPICSIFLITISLTFKHHVLSCLDRWPRTGGLIVDELSILDPLLPMLDH